MIFVLIVGNCFSAATSKFENLSRSPKLQNVDKHNSSSCCRRFSSARRMSICDNTTDSCIEKCAYVCCFCCKRFTYSTALLRHLKHHDYHTPVGSEKSAATKVVTNKRCFNTRKASGKYLEMLSCKSCSRRFTTPGKLESHMQLSHKDSKVETHIQHSHVADDDIHARASDQSQQLSSTVLKKLNGAEGGAELDTCSLRCKECGATSFKTWRGLMLHRRTRHGGRLPHTCSCCPRQFLYASDLRRHERCHTAQRPHVCTSCGKGFYHAADLEVHSRIHHGDAPPLRCSVCDRWMSSMTGLRAHMRIHRPDAPPAVCTMCDKPFSYLSSLRAHMKRQHAVKAATNTSNCWRCEHCSAEFHSHSQLSDHANSCRGSTLCHLYYISSFSPSLFLLLLPFVIILFTFVQLLWF